MKPGVLPDSWSVTMLSDIARSVGGSTPSKNDPSLWQNGTVPWVSPKDMKVFDLRSSEDAVSQRALTRLSLIPKNSILVVVRSGILARIFPVAINHFPATINQDMRAFVPECGIDARFVAWQLRANQRDILAKCSKDGTTVASIEASALASFPLALPPTNEQHRIVAKLEELFSELDKGIDSLKTAQAQLKVYRQSLLKNAFAGKLTAQWRAENADQLESADALKQRIVRERAERHRQQAADWEAAGKPGSKPKLPNPLPPLTVEELARLPELPEGWAWVRIDEVVSDRLIGLDRGAKDQTTAPPGFPYVKMNNVSIDGGVSTDNLVFVQPTAEELAKFALEEGDILFNTRNSRELVGKSGIVRKLFGPTVYNNNLMRLRVGPAVSSSFLSLQMCGGNFKKVLELAKKGTTNVAAVYAKDFFPLPVAIAHPEEQRQVVAELESKLSEAEHLDQTIATALQQAEALRQSILKKAFSGRLVPQDASDEPATALLERIRAERVAAGAGRRPKKVSSPLTVC